MKEIYRNCEIMLAADQVKSANDGLYPIRAGSREVSLPFGCDIDGQRTSQRTLSNRQLDTFETDVIHGVLGSRGWTLQERILAPRILHLGKAQVYWECRTSIWCERTDFNYASYTTPILDEAREMMTAISRKELGTASARDIAGGSKGCAIYTAWYDLVSAYSCRQLTFPGDKLPAILGLAGLFAETIQDQFIWGLWLQDIPAGLLWTVQGTGSPTRLAAPSWSWASVNGELTFYIPSTKWGRPLRGFLQVTCENISFKDSTTAQHTYLNGVISCQCPIISVLLSIRAGMNGDEGYPFDHLRKQPNAEVREVCSGFVIGNAILDDDTLLPHAVSFEATVASRCNGVSSMSIPK